MRPEKARALSRMIEGCDGLIFEAHSTDYQTPSALAALVRDHFAILKVGPGLTFALREALWALDAIEREWIEPALASGFRNVAIARMKAEPRHWAKYYHARGAALDYDLQYSLSDRIRYYWPDPEIARAQDAMFRNLTQNPPPPALISQYLPIAHAAVRDGLIGGGPAELAMAHVWAVLDGYHAAAWPARRHVMTKLGRDEGELQALGALWTAREIAQQPAMLRKTHAALVAGKDALEAFLRPLLDRAAMRVILTGAGTSSLHRRMPGTLSRRARCRAGSRRSPPPIWSARRISISRPARRRCWFRSAARATARKASPRSILPTSSSATSITSRSPAIRTARSPAGSRRHAQ